MSFWDNVKKFAQPYADDEYDEYDDEPIKEKAKQEEEEKKVPPRNFPKKDYPQPKNTAKNNKKGI